MERVTSVVIASIGLCSSASVLLDLGGGVFPADNRCYMKITEVKIVPVNEGRLGAYVSITFDHCFIISDLKLIRSKKGYLVSMPRRKRAKEHPWGARSSNDANQLRHLEIRGLGRKRRVRESWAWIAERA